MVSRYKELDALRGIAAMFVVFFHFTMWQEVTKLGFKLGVTGVDLFFMISGFVIFMSIRKVSSVLEFSINRFCRLYPTYWTCVSFTFLAQVIVAYLQPKTGSFPVLNYLGNMTMFQYYFKMPDIDGPYWTMIVEMLFYALIALIFSLKKLKYIIPIGLSILVLASINNIWFEQSFHILQKAQTHFPLLVHFPLFLAGIVFYKLKSSSATYKQKVVYWFCIVACYAITLVLVNQGGRSLQFISFKEYAGVLSV
ncbi:MAG TPA: acyltransferase, partial [Bacteroidia bacterium]